jgi:hypothetical protein
MRRYRPFAIFVLFVVVALLSAASSVSAAAVCETSLPFNIDAGTLQPVALALLQRSPTFHEQCLKIAAAAFLRVRVRVVPVLQGGLGETTITRYDTGALRADIQVRFGRDYAELLAHEFEHVLEQVEQVSLLHEVSRRRAWLTDMGAFETDRARRVGIRARQESEDLAAEAIEAHRRAAPHPRHPFD